MHQRRIELPRGLPRGLFIGRGGATINRLRAELPAGVRVHVDDSENSVCLSGHSEEELAAAELKVKAQVEGLMMGLKIRQMEQWAEDMGGPMCTVM